MRPPGSFTISLDFELYWGMRDVITAESYSENLRNVHNVIPQLLELFKKYDIHATWCIVGFLFFRDKEHLLQHIPDLIPHYTDSRKDAYKYVKETHLENVYHFAPHLIKLIDSTPNQEIGSHTFSHYYTKEKGQTIEQFKVDIQQALKYCNTGKRIDSIIFPRNQYTIEHLKIVKELGITHYRGTQNFWVYKPERLRHETKLKRLIRFLDSYINLSGYNIYTPHNDDKNLPINVPSSAFLRPFSQKLKMFDMLKLKRITNAMTLAAQQGKAYHLWWHPHNFGKNMKENLSFLEKIFVHYTELQKKHGFISKCMREY